jgi:hypothetical protein
VRLPSGEKLIALDARPRRVPAGHAAQQTIRASAGRRIRLHIAVHDDAGHLRPIERCFTPAR